MTVSASATAALDAKRLQQLIDAVGEYAIFMLDTAGRITSWGAGAERIKGYLTDEIVGQHLSRFYTDEDKAQGAVERALETALKDGKYENEGWRVRKDGSRFWASVVIDPIYDEGRKHIGFAEVSRDMTEQIEAQKALEHTRAAFAQAQKMEVIGQLTGGVAHDFNNLLTVITGALSLLSRPAGNPEQRRRVLDTARRAAERGAKLTQHLLAFSRRQALRPEDNRANDLIRGFEGVLRRVCGETVELDFELPNLPTDVYIDAAQFGVALLNLVVNARDAMPRGGELTISTRAEEIETARAGRMSSIPPGRYVVVTVADTGEGMPPEVQSRVFEPFFTTKEVGKGSGLGLSQVYGFVTQSGGHVDVLSALGQGTTVTLYLPRHVAETEREESALADRAMAASAGTILVVEDDPDVLLMSVETLRELGYDVLTAPDGPSALKQLGRDQHIDLLLTDVVMPKGMNGVELAQHARELRPELKILLASGYPMAALSKQHGLTSEYAFIGKPFEWSQLQDKIRAITATPITATH